MKDNTNPKEHEEIEMTELQPCLSAGTGVSGDKTHTENKKHTDEVRILYYYYNIIVQIGILI